MYLDSFFAAFLNAYCLFTFYHSEPILVIYIYFLKSITIHLNYQICCCKPVFVSFLKSLYIHNYMLLFLVYCIATFLFIFFLLYFQNVCRITLAITKNQSLGLFINITLRGVWFGFCFYLDNVLYYYFILIFPLTLKFIAFIFELLLFCFIYYFISSRCIFPIYKYTLLKCFPLNQDLDSSHRFCKVIFRHYSLLRSLQLFWKWYLKKMCSNSLTMQFST